MSYINIWAHMVWATKNRQPFLKSKEIREEVFNHIRVKSMEKGIYIDTINGYIEHAHVLISLKGTQSVSDVAQSIKGESSNWINKNLSLPQHFKWQDDYFAVSVSKSDLDTVRNYIRNQEIHHQKVSFRQEYEEFIKSYGFDIMENGRIIKDDFTIYEEENVYQIAARL
jgi:REP element-mobilizing transposase RayT